MNQEINIDEIVYNKSNNESPVENFKSIENHQSNHLNLRDIKEDRDISKIEKYIISLD